mgnify:CR=1 FL=1
MVTEVTGVLSINGSPTTLALAAGQNAEYTFSGLAGQSFNLNVTGFTSSPANGDGGVYVFQPDGSSLAYCGGLSQLENGCRLTLPVAGTYRVRMDPSNTYATQFTVRLNIDLNATLVSGTALNVNLATPGRHALLSFTATAGQTRALNVGTIATVPTNTHVQVTIFDPSGAIIDSGGSASGITFNLRNLLAGTYKVLIAPYGGATATTQVKLVPGLTGALSANGAGANYATTVPQQNGYFTFAGTAGQNRSLGMTNVVLTPTAPWDVVTIIVKKPDGSYLLSQPLTCYPTTVPGCQTTLRNLPVTGTYLVEVLPSGYQTMSFRLTLSASVTTTLAAGTPYTATLAYPGQSAVLSFAATAGQTRALNIDTLNLTPANSPLEIQIFDPTDTLIDGASTAIPVTFNLRNLIAGTYRVVIAPSNAATGSFRARLVAGLTGTLSANGTKVTKVTTVPGQGGYFTFAGTAGQDRGLGITNIVTTPTAVNYVNLRVFRPDGGMLDSVLCYTSTLPGCALALRNLPLTGTYAVEVLTDYATMSVGLTLSPSVTGTLTLGTPLSVNLNAAGKNAVLSFTATSGQSFPLAINTLVTTPSASPVTVYVFDPAGSIVASGSGTASFSISLSSLSAGVHKVLIWPNNAATATFQARIQ